MLLSKSRIKNIVNQVCASENLDSSENSFVIKKFQDEVNLPEGRYELPFKEFFFALEDKYEISKARLKSLTKRFKNDNSLLIQYDDIIKGQFQ